MPTILETILDYEQDMLEMISEKWGISAELLQRKKPHKEVAARIKDSASVLEIFETLKLDEQAALLDLALNKGKIKWDQFSRKYGDVREMGAIVRGRERPDRNPISTSEQLIYHALIGRGFLKSRGSLEEYAFLPDEYLEIFRKFQQNRMDDLKIPQVTSVKIKPLKWTDGIIDHITTLLAEIRKFGGVPEIRFLAPDIPAHFLESLLRDAEYMTGTGKVNAAKIKEFLKLSRNEAFCLLFGNWRGSPWLNELSLVDQISVEKGWKNEPVATRENLYTIIEKLPKKSWVSLQDFIKWVHIHFPDFLRSAGEYESWLIKDTSSGEFLRGFSNWEKIEGAYLEAWILGPAVWFGLVVIGKDPSDTENVYIRQSSRTKDLLDGKSPIIETVAEQYIRVEESGTVIISRFFPRDARYQIARFCSLTKTDANKYFYRITPESLERMENQELNAVQLIKLLKKFGKKPVPGNIQKAIRRWDKKKIEAFVNEGFILQLELPALLNRLKDSPAAPYILEQLNEKTIFISKKGIPFIKAFLLKSGFFVSVHSDSDSTN